MKKKIFAACAVFALLLAFSLSAPAALPLQAAEGSGRTMDLIMDETGRLNSSELAQLNSLAEEASARTECDIALLVTEDTGGESASQYAAAKMIEYRYGYAPNNSAVMLVYNTTESTIGISSAGDAIDVFANGGLNTVLDIFNESLATADRYGAVDNYIYVCEAYLSGRVENNNVPPRQSAYIIDLDGLLSESEIRDLTTYAKSVTEKYECMVAVITVTGLEGYSAAAYAEMMYNRYNIGYGPNRSGILLLISLEEREWAMDAYGYGNTAFTDYGKDKLSEAFLPDLSAENYYDAFYTFISTCEDFLAQARAGNPVDVGSGYSEDDGIFNFIFIVVLPLLIALIFCLSARKAMKTAVPQRAAQAYIPAGGFQLTDKRDIFRNRTEIRTRIESNSSSGGGGGTSVSSSGHSSSSGKF